MKKRSYMVFSLAASSAAVISVMLLASESRAGGQCHLVGAVPVGCGSLSVSNQSDPTSAPKWTYVDEFGQEQFKVRSPNGCFVEPGRTYVEIPIPPPITKTDLSRWATILSLSEGQQAHLERLYGEYRQRELEFHNEFVQMLWDEASDLASDGPLWEDSDRQAAFERISEVRCPKARRRLEAIEKRIFDELVPVLTSEQVEKLDTVRRLRQRQSYRLPSSYPGVELDLIELLYTIERDKREFDLQPTDRDAFHECLISYDLTLTSLVVRRGVQKPRLINAVMSAEAERAALRNYGASDEAIDDVSSRIRNYRRRMLNLEKPIFQLNEDYAQLFSGSLPAGTADRLMSSYRSTVYPTVYPDYTTAVPVLKRAAELDDLSSEEQPKVEAIVAWYEPARLNVCDQMARGYLRWREQFSLKMGYDREDFARFDRDMRGLHGQRMDLAVMSIEQLREALTDEHWTELAEWMQWHQNQLEQEFHPDPLIQIR